MSRRSAGRRALRRAPDGITSYLDLPAVGSTDLPGVFTLPGSPPPDLQDLARLLTTEGPRLLASLSPGEVGLLLVHPESSVATPDHRATGQAWAVPYPRAALLQLAHSIRTQVEVPPADRFVILMIGRQQTAVAGMLPSGGELTL